MRVLLLLLLWWLLRKLAWCIRWLWRYTRGQTPPPEPHGFPRQSGRLFAGHLPAPAVSAAADRPRPFGYKLTWLAVECRDPEQVIAALHPKSREPANWESGLSAVETGRVFVSPCLNGFVLVLGLEDAPPPDFFDGTFSEVQCFSTHRVTETHSWSLWRDGAWIRAYCWWGEGGEVLEDSGSLTPQEQALGFARFPRRGEAETAALPDEEDVRHIAAAWGVDPDMKGDFPPSTGWLCG